MEDVLLKRLLRELTGIRGTGTQLISLYIPPGYPRSELSHMLTDEYSKAGNIKDKTTRKNVQSALHKIMVYLKSIDYKIPENGLVIFCGNISPNPGETDIKLYAIEPPMPVNKIYRCDSTFYLEPLIEMTQPMEYYVVLVLDGKDATIALIKGNTYEILARVHSLAPGKHRAGGQSARRFERLRELAEHEYYKKIAEILTKIYEENKDKLKGIVIGGPGPTKNEFLNKEYLPEAVRKKILGVVDTGYTDEYGIREAMENAEEILKEAEILMHKKMFERFMGEVLKDGLADYGVKNVYQDLLEGKVEVLLLSDALKFEIFKYKCPECGYEEESVEKGKKCPVCGVEMEKVEEKDGVEELLRLAENTNAKIMVFDSGTAEGLQLLKGFGGVGAILRYK